MNVRIDLDRLCAYSFCLTGEIKEKYVRDKHEIQTEVGTKELSSQVKSVSVYDIFTCCHTEAEAQ